MSDVSLLSCSCRLICLVCSASFVFCSITKVYTISWPLSPVSANITRSDGRPRVASSTISCHLEIR